MRTLGPGSWCGEQSLLTGNPRSATVIATSAEVTLLMVNRRMFNATIGDKIAKKRDALVPFLKHISIFSELRDPCALHCCTSHRACEVTVWACRCPFYPANQSASDGYRFFCPLRPTPLPPDTKAFSLRMPSSPRSFHRAPLYTRQVRYLMVDSTSSTAA